MESNLIIQVLESIENREVAPEGLDTSLDLLLAFDGDNDSKAKALGLISEIYYWKGEVSVAKAKVSFYEKGCDCARQGIKLNINCVEAHFWLGTNLGLMGQEKGIISSLFLLPEIEFHLKESLRLDETYFFGAPHRALGWLFHMLPPWPISSGDNRKAIFHLERALELGSGFPLNYIYAGEIYLSLGKKKEAKEILTKLANWPLDRLHKDENKPMINKATLLLAKL